MYTNYLGIGSVVLIKGEGKKVMVIGYYGVDKTGKSADYMAVPYPEGFMTPDQIVGFDQNEILQVLNEGYKDIEQERFYNELKAFAEGRGAVVSSETVPYVQETVPVQQTEETITMPTQAQNNDSDIETM